MTDLLRAARVASDDPFHLRLAERGGLAAAGVPGGPRWEVVIESVIDKLQGIER